MPDIHWPKHLKSGDLDKELTSTPCRNSENIGVLSERQFASGAKGRLFESARAHQTNLPTVTVTPIESEGTLALLSRGVWLARLIDRLLSGQFPDVSDKELTSGRSGGQA